MPCQDWRVQLCSKTWLECSWVTIYSWIHTNTHLSVTATSLDSPYSQSCFYLSVRVTLLYGYGHFIVSRLLFKINASQSKQSTILTHNWELCQANLAYSDYEYMAATFIEHLFTHIKLKTKWLKPERILQCDLENREHLKYFRNVYCVMTNHSKDQGKQTTHKTTN